MSQRSWLFVLSCIALIASAFTFSIRGEVVQEMGKQFAFKQEQNGLVDSARFWGMAASLLVGGFICDAIGMKRVMFLAFFSHLVGTLGMVFTPAFDGNSQQALYWLCAFSFIMGCGNGFTETGINPLIATLYPNEKTHYLNILHAWWPGGLIIGGMIALIAGRGLNLDLGFTHVNVAGQHWVWWQILLLIGVPTIIYGLMLLPATFPKTERAAGNVSTATMIGQAFRPLFLIWAFCMLLTASTELAPQSWQASVMEKTANLDGTQILIYTSGMMFILRHFAGPIAHQISPIGLLVVSSILAGSGLYLLSFANSAATAFGYATIFGLGIAYFWPTMLGVASERFPKGGAMILCLLGTVGNAAIALTIPQMGKIVDMYSTSEVRTLESDTKLADLIIKQDDAGKDASLKLAVIDQVKARLKDPNVAVDEAISSLSPEQLDRLHTVANKAQSVGFSMAFRWVSVLPAALVVIFGLIWIYDWSRGGYKAEKILSPEEEDELLAGGSQGPTS
jgi:fucose permease